MPLQSAKPEIQPAQSEVTKNVLWMLNTFTDASKAKNCKTYDELNSMSIPTSMEIARYGINENGELVWGKSSKLKVKDIYSLAMKEAVRNIPKIQELLIERQSIVDASGDTTLIDYELALLQSVPQALQNSVLSMARIERILIEKETLQAILPEVRQDIEDKKALYNTAQSEAATLRNLADRAVNHTSYLEMLNGFLTDLNSQLTTLEAGTPEYIDIESQITSVNAQISETQTLLDTALLTQTEDESAAVLAEQDRDSKLTDYENAQTALTTLVAKIQDLEF